MDSRKWLWYTSEELSEIETQAKETAKKVS